MRIPIVLVLIGLIAAHTGGCAKSRSIAQQSQLKPKKRMIDARNAPLVAGKRNKVYHRRHCPYAANAESLTGFAAAQDAEISGYIPCEFCSPQTESSE